MAGAPDCGAASEVFNMLPVPVTRNDGSLITFVQDYVHAFFEAEDVVVDWCCLSNTCGLYNVANCRPKSLKSLISLMSLTSVSS